MANKGIVIQITGDNQVDAVFRAVEKQMQSFGNSGASATKKIDEGLVSNREGLKLMEESLGVRVPRALNAVLTNFPKLTSVVTAAAGGFALLAGGEVIFEMGKKIWDLVAGWDKSNEVLEKYYEKLRQTAEQHVMNVSSVEEATSNLASLTSQLEKLDAELERSRKGDDAWSDRSSEDIQKIRTKVMESIDANRKSQIEGDFKKSEQAIEAQKAVNSQKLIGGALDRANGELDLALLDAKKKKQRELDGLENDARAKANLQPGMKIPYIQKDAHEDEFALAEFKVRQETAAKIYRDGLETREEVTRAHTSLMEALASQEAEKTKATAEISLANLEALHARGLVSEREYYRQRLEIAETNLDAEAKSINDKIAALQDQLDKQHSNVRLHRDESGKSKQEEDTLKALADQQTKLIALAARRKSEEARTGAEGDKAEIDQQLAGLKLAAQLETERNDGIKARIALVQYESALELKKTEATFGNDSPEARQVQDLEKVQEAKLRISQIDQQIRDIEQQQRLAIDTTKEDEQAHLISKQQAQKKIADQEAEEARLIQSLLPMYQEQAAFLGGEYLQKLKTLEAEIKKLKEPQEDQGDWVQAKGMLGQTFQKMGNDVVASSTKGKNAFHDMAQSMIKDLEELSVKMIEQIYLQRLFKALSGWAAGSSGDGGDTGDGGSEATADVPGLLPHLAGGGDITGPAIVGEKGKELFIPKMPGTIIPNAGLKNLMSSKGTPAIGNLSVSLVNNSSQAVSPSNVSASFDPDTKNAIVAIVLDDLQTNGPIAQSLRIGQS